MAIENTIKIEKIKIEKKKIKDVKNIRGQITLELLIISSFLLIILIPTLIYIFSVLSRESWKVDSQQAYATLTKIISISNKLSILGEGSRTSETVYLSSSVKSINVSNDKKELFIVLEPAVVGRMEVVAISNVNITLDPTKDWSNVKGAQTLIFNVTNGEIVLSKVY